MVELNGILLGILYALPVLVVFELWERVWSRYAPDRARRVYSKVRWYYFYPFRWAIPDTIYKLWYQTGIMDEEAYRVQMTDDEYENYGNRLFSLEEKGMDIEFIRRA